jgi:hypothetical protein
VQCEVIAPSLVPVKAGDRVKTDRRNAFSHSAVIVIEVMSPSASSPSGTGRQLL